MTDPVLTPGTPFARTVASVRAGTDLDAAVDGFLVELTDRGLLWLLDGDLRLRAARRRSRSCHHPPPIRERRRQISLCHFDSDA